MRSALTALALALFACNSSSPVSPDATGIDPVAARMPKTQWVICWDGSKVKYGKPCPDVPPPPTPTPTPDPTPTPTPPPTHTCWDGSVIPDADACPVQPPPPPPTQTCPDGSVILLSEACPPPPTKPCWDGSTVLLTDLCPPIPPPPAGTYTQAQIDARLAKVMATGVRATNFGNSGLQPAWPSEVQGAFRFICGAGQLRYDDPIVFPGQPGKSHLHQFYGNTSANANSTRLDLQMNGDSTCNNVGPNGAPGNPSSYWMPAMLDGKGHVIMPDFVQVYYKREPQKYPASIVQKIKDYNLANPTKANPNAIYTNCELMGPALGEKCGGIPDGIKFISGFDMVSHTDPNRTGAFKCGSVTSKANVDGMEMLTNATCPVGSRMEVLIQGERCHNGQPDSPDHRSHVAGAKRDATTKYITACPPGFSTYMPAFTIGAFYTIRVGDDVSLWHLSSDMPGMKRGSTLHFDYFEAWWPQVKDMWQGSGGCIELYLNCSAGFLGSGKGLVGADSGTVNIEAAKFDHRPLIPDNPNGMKAQ